MSESECPICGAEIPEPSVRSAPDVDTQMGEPNAQQAEQHIECPCCGAHLERMQVPGLGHDWRTARATE